MTLRRAAGGLPPRVALAATVVAALGGEALLWAGPFAAGQDAGHVGWVVLAAVVVATLLSVTVLGDAVGTGRARLRPLDVVVAATAVTGGLLVIGTVVGGTGPSDLEVYQRLGTTVLDTGGLPVEQPAEYPPLAVLLFAAGVLLDRVLPGGFAVAWGVLMTLVASAGWVALARRVPPWAVATATVWPTVTVFALIRFDLAPAVLLVGGLLLAAPASGRGGAADRVPEWRRAAAAGALLGLGAAAKWFPGLAAGVLVVGWWRQGRRRAAALLAGGTAAGFALPHLPFLFDAAQRTALLEAYRFHAGRALTGESLPFLPLHALGLVDRPDRPWGEVAVDGVAAWLPTALLVLALVAPYVLAVWHPRAALAWAVLAPIAFLLANRIFSPQFLLPIVLLWAVTTMTGRVTTSGRVVAVWLVGAAATADWAVWPVLADGWVTWSWGLFAALGVLVATGVARLAGAAPGRRMWLPGRR